MTLNLTNRNLITAFLSLFGFVAMITVATMIPGWGGVQMATGIMFPLGEPMIIIAALTVGVLTGSLRASLLFYLPISFCIGFAVGLMCATQPILLSAFSSMAMLAVVSWAISVWLLSSARHMKFCVLCMMLSFAVGSRHVLEVEALSNMAYVLPGALISTLLLVAIGVCTVVTMMDARQMLPDFLSDAKWKQHLPGNRFKLV